MAIKDVNSKCWILALFVRDDNERFLLGDGNYEFVENQLHFVANNIANDVVEVQGNDGYLLAGQVRRPSVQSFDGYVGDASTSKAVVEERRRAFFAFFRKNHFYKVIYVFPDGSAIQRKRGFLVDAPEVKELWQIYPKYHVALNFEDINYYYYDENADGEEIYGKSATISLNPIIQAGGLIWADPGTTITEEGTSFTVDGTLAGSTLSSLQLKGDTEQNGTPTPDLPVEVQTVTGRQVVTITDGGSRSQEYEVNLGKNMLTFDDFTRTESGIIATTSDNSITVTGTNTRQDYTYRYADNGSPVALPNVLPAGTYTISYDAVSGATNSQSLLFSFRNANDVTLANNVRISPVTKSRTFTITEDAYLFRVAIESLTYNVAVDIKYDGIQLEKGSTATTYAPCFEPIELCKIGDYQDYFYKSDGSWYLHKAIQKTILGQDELSSNWYTVGSTQKVFVKRTRFGAYSVSVKYIMSDKYNGVARDSIGSNTICLTDNGDIRFDTLDTYGSVSGFLSMLASNNVTAYYTLPTPTDQQITNTALVSQLEAVAGASTYAGQTIFTVNGNGNLAAILSVELQITGGGGVLWGDGGAEWEEGKPSYSVITIDSIDNVYPVVTITGKTVNPIIADVTTGTAFRYNGTITASQVLVIDMLNKTAALNGISVIGNVTGEWLYLAPGNNRVTYTADNADAPNATIEWQEIVG